MIPRFVWKLIRNADFQDAGDVPDWMGGGGAVLPAAPVASGPVTVPDWLGGGAPVAPNVLAPGGGGDPLAPGGTPGGFAPTDAELTGGITGIGGGSSPTFAPTDDETSPGTASPSTTTVPKDQTRAPGQPGVRDRQVPTRRQGGAAGGNPMQQILQMLFQAAGQGNPQAMNMLRSLMGGGQGGGMGGFGGMGGYMNPVMRTLAGMGRGPFGRFGRHGHGRFGGGFGGGGQFGGIPGLMPGQNAALQMMSQNADNAARQALLNQGRNPNSDTTYAQMRANIDTQLAAAGSQMLQGNLAQMNQMEQQNFARDTALGNEASKLFGNLSARDGTQPSPGSFSPGTQADSGSDTTDTSA